MQQTKHPLAGNSDVLSELLSNESGIFRMIEIATPDVSGSDLSVIITFRNTEEIFVPSHETTLEKVKVSGFSRKTDCTRILSFPWKNPADIEFLLFDIAWRLGAGYLVRYHKATPPAEWGHEPGAGFTRLFTGNPFRDNISGDYSVGDTSPELLEIALENGCWTWEFNSTYNNHLPEAKNLYWKKWYAEDKYRNEEGYREYNFPFDKFLKNKWWEISRKFYRTNPGHAGLEVFFDFTALKVKSIYDIN
jgi:hypothetical protein